MGGRPWRGTLRRCMLRRRRSAAALHDGGAGDSGVVEASRRTWIHIHLCMFSALFFYKRLLCHLFRCELSKTSPPPPRRDPSSRVCGALLHLLAPRRHFGGAPGMLTLMLAPGMLRLMRARRHGHARQTFVALASHAARQRRRLSRHGRVLCPGGFGLLGSMTGKSKLNFPVCLG